MHANRSADRDAARGIRRMPALLAVLALVAGAALSTAATSADAAPDAAAASAADAQPSAAQPAETAPAADAADDGGEAVADPQSPAPSAPADEQPADEQPPARPGEADPTTDAEQPVAEPDEVEQPDTADASDGPAGDDAAETDVATTDTAKTPSATTSKDVADVTPLAVPNPTNTTAVINVSVGGARTGTSTVADLSGVTLRLHADSGNQAGAALTDAWATCVSDADGDCSFTVPDAKAGSRGERGDCIERFFGICIEWDYPNATSDGANYDKRFWVKAVSAPSGWYLNQTLQTSGGVEDYAFRTSRVIAGNTYQSGDHFMTSGNGSSTSGGTWQLSNRNPQLSVSCSAGLSVALVLDLSGSVANAGAVDDLRDSAKGMVDALAGTGSSMALYTFADSAPRPGSPNYASMPIDQGGNAATIKSRIDAYSASGGTNWDAGLYQVALANAGYDLAIVITDGLPTFYGSSGGDGQTTRFIEDENAIFSANAIKAQGTRLVAVGVGSGISGSAVNLRAVSGETAYTSGSQASLADYFQADWDELADLLAEVARGATCQATIEVTKQTVPYGSTPRNGGAGWTFAASATNGSLSPAGAQTTPSSGTVSWTLGFSSPTPAPADVDITESLSAAQGAAGWSLESVSCTVNGADAGDGTDLSVTSGDAVACVVVNTQSLVPGIDIVKRAWSAASAADLDGADEIAAGSPVESGTVVTWTYVVTNTGQTALDDIDVADDQGVDVTCPRSSLSPGQSMTCTGSGPVTAS